MTTATHPFEVIGTVDINALFNPPAPTLEYRPGTGRGDLRQSLDGKPVTIIGPVRHSCLPETRGEPMCWVQVGTYQFAAMGSELVTITGPKWGDCDRCHARCQELRPDVTGWVCAKPSGWLCGEETP